MESLKFTALGGECELYGVDVSPAALAEGEAWVAPDARAADTLRPLERAVAFQRFGVHPRSEAGRRFGGWVAVSRELELLLRESLRAFAESDGLVHVGRAAGAARRRLHPRLRRRADGPDRGPAAAGAPA